MLFFHIYTFLLLFTDKKKKKMLLERSLRSGYFIYSNHDGHYRIECFIDFDW